MRRRLVLGSLAITVLVVVSLLVPLAMLVRDQAANRAIVAGENDAQGVAGLVALATAVGDSTSVSGAVGDLPDGTVVVLADGTIIGEMAREQGVLVERAVDAGATFAGLTPGGWEMALPVVGGDGVAVVDTFVPNAVLRQGVLTSWLLLGLLAIVLVGIGVVVADRMARALVKPIDELAASAHQIAEGDLSVRVEPSDPTEIREVGEAFNEMASRLDGLLQEERESAADLSHRLRTPLTSLRLQAESLSNPSDRHSMLTQIDRLERAMDRVIELARSRGGNVPAECELNEVVGRRVEFWRVLAEDQGRDVTLQLADGVGFVGRSEEEVESVVDILIDNVFSHTPQATPFHITTGSDESGPWLRVADEGSGLGDADAVDRGVSGSGSSGLGLDIVRKVAGQLTTYDRPGGGAVIQASFTG